LQLAALPENDITDDSVVMSTHYQDLDLGGRRAESVEFTRCRFTSVRLAGSRLAEVAFAETVLDRCDLANVAVANGSMWSRRSARPG
jgi:uncharacterized protein YjbI with pentapeptide repeats